MNAFYDDILQTAKDLIQEFGRDISIVQIDPSDYSIIDPPSLEELEAVQGVTVRAVMCDLESLTENHAISKVKESLIPRGNRGFLIAHDGVNTWEASNKIIDGDQEFMVEKATLIQPGDTALFWFLEVGQ